MIENKHLKVTKINKLEVTISIELILYSLLFTILFIISFESFLREFEEFETYILKLSGVN